MIIILCTKYTNFIYIGAGDEPSLHIPDNQTIQELHFLLKKKNLSFFLIVFSVSKNYAYLSTATALLPRTVPVMKKVATCFDKFN